MTRSCWLQPRGMIPDALPSERTLSASIARPNMTASVPKTGFFNEIG
ncbi:hypothetical protein K788_00025370 (plasmid) [Paraburkholderia caribensis MBA4]|uniref:Uncharacterized protein n=1 Tax=Paraburkholderia caribensis MBA4 TaxID=1323664 RepID=A0A0P0RLA2_9BURK|nr:hypothetical protein K788_00025370 [Paraburkholderia caribensis MBA4]